MVTGFQPVFAGERFSDSRDREFLTPCVWLISVKIPDLGKSGSLTLRRRCKMLVAPGEMKWNPGLKIYDKQKGAFTKVAKGSGVTRTANTGV
jgi:hypothetical protein